MAVQASRPANVQSITDLTNLEVQRYSVVWLRLKASIRGNSQIPRENLQAILDASAAALGNFALQRGFYSAETAQTAEIDIQIAPKFIVQKPDSLRTVLMKTVSQVVFGALGWVIASSNPVIGMVVAASGSIVSSNAYKEQLRKIC